MSEYSDDYGTDPIEAEFTHDSILTLVDVDGVPDGYADESEEYASAPDSEYADPGYADPNSSEPASMYNNWSVDTAVSSNPGGDEFYINLGDGQFYSQA